MKKLILCLFGSLVSCLAFADQHVVVASFNLGIQRQTQMSPKFNPCQAKQATDSFVLMAGGATDVRVFSVDILSTDNRWQHFEINKVITKGSFTDWIKIPVLGGKPVCMQQAVVSAAAVNTTGSVAIGANVINVL